MTGVKPIISTMVHPITLLNLYNTNNNASTSISIRSATIITGKVLSTLKNA